MQYPPGAIINDLPALFASLVSCLCTANLCEEQSGNSLSSKLDVELTQRSAFRRMGLIRRKAYAFPPYMLTLAALINYGIRMRRL